MSAETVTEKVRQLYGDRPTAKVSPPFRLVREGRWEFAEYDQEVPVDGGVRKMPMRIIVEDGGYAPQEGVRIKEFLQLYFSVCSRVDGLLASIEQLTTENMELQARLKRQEDQLTDFRRKAAKQEK